jgi:hypothetical protein
MLVPTIARQDRKNDPRLAAFRANATGVCAQSPQRKDSGPKPSLADIAADEAFGSGAFFIGKGDALVSKDPRFTNAACLSETELAEYAAETGDYSYSDSTYDSYGYDDGYEEVFDAYMEAEEESYYIEQYGIYEQEQYQRDLENGDLACAAPWASDEDPYDFAITQESAADPSAPEAALKIEADLGPAADSEPTPLAAAFTGAASGVETPAVDPAPADPAPADPAPADPAPAAEPEASPAVKVAAAPAPAPAV